MVTKFASKIIKVLPQATLLPVMSKTTSCQWKRSQLPTGQVECENLVTTLSLHLTQMIIIICTKLDSTQSLKPCEL